MTDFAGASTITISLRNAGCSQTLRGVWWTPRWPRGRVVVLHAQMHRIPHYTYYVVLQVMIIIVVVVILVLELFITENVTKHRTV